MTATNTHHSDPDPNILNVFQPPHPLAGNFVGQQVERIYMEYCEGGDLMTHFENLMVDNVPVPEEYLWRLLECMSSACLMMENGTLDA